jgi:hypothetical protein
MSRTVVFSSYRAEVPWTARLARELHRYGVRSHLWVFDEVERAMGEDTGAFDEVVDLMTGFDRRAAAELDQDDLLRRVRDLEKYIGETFLHREAAIDRRLTGLNHIELPTAHISDRWTWPQIAMLALHVESEVMSRLRALQPAALMVDPVLLPERLLSRLVKTTSTKLMVPTLLPYLPDRLYFIDRLDAQWPQCIDFYRSDEPIPADAGAAADTAIASIRTTSTMLQRRSDVRDYLPRARDRFGPARVTNIFTTWEESRRESRRGGPHSTYPELVTPWARLRRKSERYRVRRAFDRWARRSLPDAPFATYFLHSQPEITVEGWAFEFQDQVALVRNIVAALPADMVLAVKEHRVQAGLRDPAFYEELLSIPGVVLLHDSLDPRALLHRTRAVFTLTGTVSLEAMCLGTPTVIFGEIYFEHFDGVRRVHSVRELQEVAAALDQLEPASEEQIRRAFAARHIASQPGGWMQGGRIPADEVTTARAVLAALDE